MIQQGLIQSFEYTHELAWNVMKDYSIYQGNNEISGSRDASRYAFKVGLVEDGHIWMQMLESRNKTSHTYNEEVANEIFIKIQSEYIIAFIAFKEKMKTLKEKKK